MKKKPDTKFASVMWLMAQYDDEPRHAEHVTTLALKMFDDLKQLHRSGEHERDLLEAGGLLHDIGWSQGESGHHKSSMNLILSSGLEGWTENDELIIANIARYHRKSLPKSRHKKFDKLSKADQLVVWKMASLLRLADGLDHFHDRIVNGVSCHIGSDNIEMTLTTREDTDPQIPSFEKKKDMFEMTFGKSVTIKTDRSNSNEE